MSIYQLYGGAAASTDSIASLDVQFDGTIVAWNIAAYATGWDADDEQFAVEASFGSSNAFITNDARATIAMARSHAALVTSGAPSLAINHSLSGLAIPAMAGERIHLHLSVATGLSVAANVCLYVSDGANPTLRRRR